ncbi:FAD binding domain-containing protein [Pseudomonas veronii]|uniref:FAD binding domain-containing protein n=1 Tax=Pseudomonas veronii TaxID=76761 RepID=UPI002D79CADA|nr:FAD binding domain-containing protein [Pseudomonas veronii]WRU61169.1 FAD binding domain-containing protein [Pseudomonas veronii]
MKAAIFDYVRPKNLTAGLEALSDQSAGIVKVMGGSQSLGPMLNLRLARPNKVVDVSGFPEMQQVVEDGNWLVVGASITHSQIEDGIFPQLRGSLLSEVAPQIAYRAIRNRGTIGGSLAHADPAADWVLVAFALGAEVELQSSRGKRRLSMPEFMLGAYTTALAEDELISAVRLPRLGQRAVWGYHKLCRKTGEFAEASCCAVFDPDRGLARIVLGALDGPPSLLGELSVDVAKRGVEALGEEALVNAATSVTPGKDPVDRQLCITALRRCLHSIFKESKA